MRYFKQVNYNELNGKQQEAYNFHKSTAVLADYGFYCVKVIDDLKNADLIACRHDGTLLKVQLKGRLTIQRDYLGKNLWMLFPVNKRWHLIPHDLLVRIVSHHTPCLKNNAWNKKPFECHWKTPPERLRNAIKDCCLEKSDA